MTQNEKIPTWRDNKTVLWLVRVGFALQFYIPAVICCYIILSCYLPLPYLPYHLSLNQLFDGFIDIGAFMTLAVLLMQWSVFTMFLRGLELRFISPLLACLIAINVLHSTMWVMNGLDLTMYRLISPTVIYMIAIFVELGTSKNALTETNLP